MKTLNQLYKESGVTISFKEWVAGGQKVYNEQKAAKKFPAAITFIEWANAYSNFVKDKKHNAAGDPAGVEMSAWEKAWAWLSNSKNQDTMGDLLKTGVDIYNRLNPDGTPNPNYQPGSVPTDAKTTILGMSVGTFVAVTGVVVVLIGVGIWAIVRKNK